MGNCLDPALAAMHAGRPRQPVEPPHGNLARNERPACGFGPALLLTPPAAEIDGIRLESVREVRLSGRGV